MINQKRSRSPVRRKRRPITDPILAIAAIIALLPAMRSDTTAQDPAGINNLLGGIAVGDSFRSLSYHDLDQEFENIRSAGASAVRMDFSWPAVQADGPDAYDWSDLDRIVERATAHDIRVLAIPTYTPPWARMPGCHSDKCHPANPQQFADFAREAAARYIPMGVTDWEIWNEPNIVDFWKPAPDPQAYAQLLAESASAIRQVDPSVNILSGGLAAATPEPGNIPAVSFLDQILHHGAARHIDIVSYHPYTYPLSPHHPPGLAGRPNAWADIAHTPHSLRATLTHHGALRPIWITEYGAPTDGPGSASDGDPADITDDTDHVTEQQQARLASDAVAAATDTPGVVAFFWHTHRDFDAEGSTEGYYGLYREDGSAKPALRALSSALHQPNALLWRQRPPVDG